MNGMTGIFPEPRAAVLPAQAAKQPRTGAVGHATDVTGELRSKMEEAHALYLNIAKPRDLRFAERVHGAALAPPWNEIWTDDPM
eukprot:2047289-Rhodomonas_salina.1